jgi:hypothetical protein
LIARDDDEASVFLALVALVAVVLAIVVAATYVVRVAIMVVLVAGAPLALVWHCLPQTEGVAVVWWRAFAACLATQLGQSLAVVAAARVFFTGGGWATLGLPTSGGLVDLVVICCLLILLIKIPFWAARIALRGTGHRRSTVVSVVRSVLIYKGLRATGILAPTRRGGPRP